MTKIPPAIPSAIEMADRYLRSKRNEPKPAAEPAPEQRAKPAKLEPIPTVEPFHLKEARVEKEKAAKREDLSKYTAADRLLIANGGRPSPLGGPREGLRRKGGPKNKSGNGGES